MEQKTKRERVVIGISGASGMAVAHYILKVLREKPEIETHLVVSESARLTIQTELNSSLQELEDLADVVHDIHKMSASIASGSFPVKGMIVVPCSMKTAAGIAGGYTDNLLLRAADCMIKERRRLVLVVRECPFSPIHLRNLTFLAECGVDILPMVMTFYNGPQTIEDMVIHIASKALERLGIDSGSYRRWGDTIQEGLA
ncbi:aromatic acid decarboxylase [Blautia sp. An249]|uniref:UbiX family flavin prenyltransferase n=1 Tax=Blautia sp. An249 TaxID=1965603 RepID=UPI000B36B20F|nr:UbiX family flavin prenyltransferase [Blautia sp. An249]OUO79304.1 aromatic acid decarboxylase [Blautia sp. An249]